MNAPTPVPDLSVNGLCITGPDGEIVGGVSFHLRPGMPVTLLGESGSGKSLVAHAIMGDLPAGLRAQGSVTFGGADLLHAAPAAVRARWGRSIALLPQEPWLALDPTMRAGAQVAETYRHVRGFPAGRSRAMARAALAEVGLPEAGAAYPFALSGGMCQRVAVAITHAADAALLIADEPTKGLDADLRDAAVARLREEVARGRLVLAITHDIAVARGLGGMTGVMLDGRLVEFGPTEQVLSAPRHAYARAIIEADPARWPARPAPKAGDTVLQASGLTKRIEGRTLFQGLDLTARRGEVTAIVGPSGCGKTTLGNILLGLARPDAGTLARAPGLAPLQFQKLYQDPPAAFAPHQTLGAALDDLVALHGLDRGNARALMAELRLPPALLARRPAEVSGGELQRFALLRTLLLKPAFLFADEATSRLDPVTQRQVAEILLDAVRDRGLSLLLVTHDPALAERMASAVMALG